MASNAFFKSMNAARVDNLLSRDDDIFSDISTKAVTVDLFCLKPYWLSLKSSFFIENYIIFFHKIFLIS